jgi:hypothetical protein
MAVAGSLDLVALDGEIYQVQTELTDAARGRVRTVIFHDGAVVAVNQSELQSAVERAGDAAGVREIVERHHQRVLRGFVAHTSRFVERLHGGQVQPASPAATPQARSTPTADIGDELALPPVPDDPALADAIDVRRLFALVWRRIRGTALPASVGPTAGLELAGPAVAESLDRAAEALAWAVEQPGLQRARIDEQARFHLLRGRVAAWVERGRDPAAVSLLWREVVLFSQYVSEINLRAELIAYDRELIAWARGSLLRQGPGRSTLKPLAWLFGRDPEVDELLAGGTEAPADVWVALLDRIWSGLGDQ